MKDLIEIRWHGRGGQGAKTGLYAMPICHNIPQEVTVRKYTCDIEKLKTLLRESKNKTNPRK